MAVRPYPIMASSDGGIPLPQQRTYSLGTFPPVTRLNTRAGESVSWNRPAEERCRQNALRIVGAIFAQMDIADAISETFSVDGGQSTTLSDNMSITDTIELNHGADGARQHPTIEMGRPQAHGRMVSIDSVS